MPVSRGPHECCIYQHASILNMCVYGVMQREGRLEEYTGGFEGYRSCLLAQPPTAEKHSTAGHGLPGTDRTVQGCSGREVERQRLASLRASLPASAAPCSTHRPLTATL